MSDYALRILAKEAGVRLLACTTTGLAREAAQRHSAYPIATAALAYGMTAGVLLGALLKVQERVALKVDGNGRLGKLVVEADAYGHVRGYLSAPDASSGGLLDRAAVGDALGRKGILTVVKDLRLRDLYRSAVSLQYGELDKELETYLNQSEQIPSLVEIGVVMNEDRELASSGGLLIQALPGHGHEAVAQLAARLNGLPSLETLLADGMIPEQIVEQLMGGQDYLLLERQPVEFRCTCSQERSRQALRLLDRNDLLALVAEGEATVDCHFCHARYFFARAELEAILAEAQAAAGDGETPGTA